MIIGYGLANEDIIICTFDKGCGFCIFDRTFYTQNILDHLNVGHTSSNYIRLGNINPGERVMKSLVATLKITI